MAIDRLRVRLHDILDAIARIEANVAGKDFSVYQSDGNLQWIVERGIEIISEASRHIPGSLTDAHPEIEWRAIRGIGNRMRHEYDRLDPFMVWTIATVNLGELKNAVNAMLASLDRNKTI